MKLRQLTGESDPDEMLSYLEKRHPLYFLQRKLSKPQIKNLVKKLIYRMGQTNPKKETTTARLDSKPAPVPQPQQKNVAASQATAGVPSQNKRGLLKELENKALEKENVGKPSAPTFKTGSQLPSLSDDLPGLGRKKQAGVKFADAFDDDFSAGEDEDVDSPNEANNEDEDEDGDFDANELLNLGAYQ